MTAANLEEIILHKRLFFTKGRNTLTAATIFFQLRLAPTTTTTTTSSSSRSVLDDVTAANLEENILHKRTYINEE